MEDSVILLNANGADLKNPTDMGYEYYNLTKSGRTASGKMTMDIIAQKRKFTCVYDSMNSIEWNKMMTAVFDSTKPFYTLHYFKDNVWTDCTVYTGDITKKLSRTGAVWYYKDVKIDFIEQ